MEHTSNTEKEIIIKKKLFTDKDFSAAIIAAIAAVMLAAGLAVTAAAVSDEDVTAKQACGSSENSTVIIETL